MSNNPHVVIVGAGFGGLGVAEELAHAPVVVTLIDRHNYHTFQPLLYLSGGDFSAKRRRCGSAGAQHVSAPGERDVLHGWAFT